MQLCIVGCGLADHPVASDSETPRADRFAGVLALGRSLGLALFPTCDPSDLDGRKERLGINGQNAGITTPLIRYRFESFKQRLDGQRQ